MNKKIILLSILWSTLMFAQDNSSLYKQFEKQKNDNDKKFNSYVRKIYGENLTKEKQKEVDSLRRNLAGFNFDVPYFYQEEDERQLKNSNADLLNSPGNIVGLGGAFNGEGINYFVFDGGRVYEAHSIFNNIPGRITNHEASSYGYSDHATGVSGFIGGKNSPLYSNQVLVGNGKGVASNSTIGSYKFETTTLPGNSTTSTVFQKILIAQPNISNHSYGVNAGWNEVYSGNSISSYVYNGYKSGNTFYDYQGTYNTNDTNYDIIAYNNPSYIIVKSAGNYFGMGPTGSSSSSVPKYYRSSTGNVAFSTTDVLPANNCSLGYDCIGTGSLAKNIIVVGATDIIANNNYRYNNSADVVHSGYSSAGPRDDGGIKPDISTVGTSVYYAATTATGSNAWGQGSGTSFAAPIVTGIIGLWTQIYRQLFNNASLDADSAKNLMIHSASEAGNIGPDPWYGWGFIDAKKGAELLVGKANGMVIFEDEVLNSTILNTKVVKALGTEPLKVTISWLDPQYTPNYQYVGDVNNNRSSKLINDIDLRIVDMIDNTVYYPWRLDANSPLTPATKADNTVDNVEQVIIDTPISGRNYRIEISNKGTLVNGSGVAAPQNYSIIVTGHSEVLGTDDVNIGNTLAVVPTITKDFVKILKAGPNSTYTLFDVSGKKLKAERITSAEIVVDFSGYPKGVYILEINNDKSKVIKKILKD